MWKLAMFGRLEATAENVSLLHSSRPAERDLFCLFLGFLLAFWVLIHVFLRPCWSTASQLTIRVSSWTYVSTLTLWRNFRQAYIHFIQLNMWANLYANTRHKLNSFKSATGIDIANKQTKSTRAYSSNKTTDGRKA